jgi:hypothetical protein
MHTGWHRSDDVRRGVALLLVVILGAATLVSCASPSPSSAAVDGNGATVTTDGVTFVAGGDAASVGTVLSIDKQPYDYGQLARYVDPVGASVEVKLGDRVQPLSPLTATFTVDEPLTDLAKDGETIKSLVVMTASRGGDLDLLPVVWDGESKTVAVRVTHLSWFQLGVVDLNSVWKSVRDSVLQATGIESARPSCEGKVVTAAGRQVSALSPWGAWVCLTGGDSLQVTLTSNAPVPFRVAPVGATTSQPEVSTSGIFTQALFNLFVPGAKVLSPGGEVTVDFGTTAPQNIKLRQDAGALVLAILVRTLEVMVPQNINVLDAMGKLECTSKIVDSGTSPSLSTEQVAKIFSSFFSCVGPLVGDIALPVKVALAIISAAPLFFAGAIIGLINEFTGMRSMEVILTVTEAPKPKRWIIDATGFGPVVIGGTLNDVKSDSTVAVSDMGHPWCGTVEGNGWLSSVAPAGEGSQNIGSLLLMDDYRSNGSAEVPSTAAGITLGSTEHELLEAYPEANPSNAPYSRVGKAMEDFRDYVVTFSGTPITFGTVDGVVDAIAIGNDAIPWELCN